MASVFHALAGPDKQCVVSVVNSVHHAIDPGTLGMLSGEVRERMQSRAKRIYHLECLLLHVANTQERSLQTTRPIHIGSQIRLAKDTDSLLIDEGGVGFDARDIKVFTPVITRRSSRLACR